MGALADPAGGLPQSPRRGRERVRRSAGGPTAGPDP